MTRPTLQTMSTFAPLPLARATRHAYLTPETGVTSGGFYPNGVNGTIASM